MPAKRKDDLEAFYAFVGEKLRSGEKLNPAQVLALWETQRARNKGTLDPNRFKKAAPRARKAIAKLQRWIAAEMAKRGLPPATSGNADEPGKR
jgi:hypothetical protein